MSNPGHNAPRVTCPRCRANNFTGKTHCWQCSAPLPPPEAVGLGAPVGSSRGTAAGGSSARASNWAPQAQRSHAGGIQAPHHANAAAEQPSNSARDDAFVRKWGMSRGIAALTVAVALGMFLVVWAVAGRMHSASEPVRATSSEPAPIFAPTPQETPAARAVTDDSDPVVAESKRFIERESRHAGLHEPPAASDGRVHLRGGGSISTDQYRDAQRRLQESPVLHTPIPAPPMP